MAEQESQRELGARHVSLGFSRLVPRTRKQIAMAVLSCTTASAVVWWMWPSLMSAVEHWQVTVLIIAVVVWRVKKYREGLAEDMAREQEAQQPGKGKRVAAAPSVSSMR